MREFPEDRTNHVGVVITNAFDPGTVDVDVARKMVAPDAWAEYTAWDFWGKVWCEDEQFHVYVMVRHRHVDTISAGTLEELARLTCEKWGDD